MDHVVTNNLKTNKDQLNEAINNEPIFHTNIFDISSGTIEFLILVTVFLLRGKKHI